MRKGSTTRRAVEQVVARDGEVASRTRRDVLATEEPLEIRIVQPGEGRGTPAERVHPVSVTMRTPGADFELAAGFLFSEGILDLPGQIAGIRYCVDAALDGTQQYNIVNVHLARGTPFDPDAFRRNFYTTSSCGVCGKASIEAVLDSACAQVSGEAVLDAATLLGLPDTLRAQQAIFDRTGGLHAAALYSLQGELIRLREDVGRHNAMDKLVGSGFLAAELPFSDRVVLVSGRLSFELVQKAARAGVTILAGVSAPSSLAVELAESAGMTLVGFLREGRFNMYAGAYRIHVPINTRVG